mmetsp:Transcript_51048/g.128836  ORF Transcript_51048/g.128836 Transcript_51048/m.128836 type:complete len:269 (-) Transcript_51048:963-1769(-)
MQEWLEREEGSRHDPMLSAMPDCGDGMPGISISWASLYLAAAAAASWMYAESIGLPSLCAMSSARVYSTKCWARCASFLCERAEIMLGVPTDVHCDPLGESRPELGGVEEAQSSCANSLTSFGSTRLCTAAEACGASAEMDDLLDHGCGSLACPPTCSSPVHKSASLCLLLDGGTKTGSSPCSSSCSGKSTSDLQGSGFTVTASGGAIKEHGLGEESLFSTDKPTSSLACGVEEEDDVDDDVDDDDVPGIHGCGTKVGTSATMPVAHC